MHSNLVFLAVIFLMLMVAQNKANPLKWKCKECSTLEECEAPPKEPCPWGETRDKCRRRICMRGPGERCGGYFQLFGTCGEGLMCDFDELCHGCHIESLVCYPKKLE